MALFRSCTTFSFLACSLYSVQFDLTAPKRVVTSYDSAKVAPSPIIIAKRAKQIVQTVIVVRIEKRERGENFTNNIEIQLRHSFAVVIGGCRIVVAQTLFLTLFLAVFDLNDSHCFFWF